MLTQAERLEFKKAAGHIAFEAGKNYLQNKFMVWQDADLARVINRMMPEAIKKASEGALRSLNLNNSLSELARENFAMTIMEVGVKAAEEVGYYPKVSDAVATPVGPIPNEAERLKNWDIPGLAIRLK